MRIGWLDGRFCAHRSSYGVVEMKAVTYARNPISFVEQTAFPVKFRTEVV